MAAHGTLSAVAGALDQAPAGQVARDQGSWRVVEVKAGHGQAVDLAHDQRAGHALPQRQCLLDRADEQYLARPSGEGIGRRGEGADDVNHHHRSRGGTAGR
jgi:hypothetical protein